jgi:O-antigen ligase/cytochrome c-type biogenesis protein CcmH/NrfG
MRRGEDTFESSFLRQALVWLVALKSAGLILVFDPVAISAFDMAKSMFSRAIEWLLVAVLFLSLFRFGIRIMPRTHLHLAVALVLLANVIAAALAVNTFVGLYGEFERYLGLSFVVDMFVLYVAVAIGYRRDSDWALLLTVSAGTALFVLGYAVVQRAGVDPINWGGPIARPFATLGNPDFFGRYLSVVFGLALGLVMFTRGTLRVRSRVAMIVFVLVLTVVAGIVATRSSLLGFAGAGVVGAICHASWTRRATYGRGLFLAVAAGAVVIGLVGLSPLGERTRQMIMIGIDREPRLSIYRTAIAAFEARPIFGYGPDGFAVAYPANRDQHDAFLLQRERESNAHSWVLQTLATTGILGFATLVWLIVSSSLVLWRSGASGRQWLAGPLLLGLAAYWADGLVSVGTVGVDWFPWLAFGAAAVIAGDRREPLVSLRSLPALAQIGVMVIAALVGSWGLVALSASEEIWQARILWSGGSTMSIDHAEQAVRLDPGRADYWNWLGLTRELAQNWRSSGDAYAEASRRAPHDPLFWSNLALSRARQALADDLSSGGPPAAIAAARRAVDVDPNNPHANAVLGEVANAFGQPDLALSSAVTAVVLYPIDPAYDDLVLRASRDAMDLRGAAASLERALKAKDSVQIRVAAGEIALRLGDIPSARVHASRAAELAPTDAEVVKLLGQIPKG